MTSQTKSISNDQITSYNEVRGSTDIDLVAVVRQRLVTAGLEGLVVANFDTNHYIVEAANKRPDVQRYLLNRFWNLQLMSAPAISIEERYCLVPNGTVDEWLHLFDVKVLPFIVKNHLPISI